MDRLQISISNPHSVCYEVTEEWTDSLYLKPWIAHMSGDSVTSDCIMYRDLAMIYLYTAVRLSGDSSTTLKTCSHVPPSHRVRRSALQMERICLHCPLVVWIGPMHPELYIQDQSWIIGCTSLIEDISGISPSLSGEDLKLNGNVNPSLLFQ